jgi:hypothetical protein
LSCFLIKRYRRKWRCKWIPWTRHYWKFWKNWINSDIIAEQILLWIVQVYCYITWPVVLSCTSSSHWFYC